MQRDAWNGLRSLHFAKELQARQAEFGGSQRCVPTNQAIRRRFTFVECLPIIYCVVKVIYIDPTIQAKQAACLVMPSIFVTDTITLVPRLTCNLLVVFPSRFFHKYSSKYLPSEWKLKM